MVAAVAALMVGVLAVQGQSAFAKQFDNNFPIQVNNHLRGQNVVPIQQSNINDANVISHFGIGNNDD
ncbi:MAG TPA: hypothetical protein VH500_09085 [Nitrososphaeraceae archaeon]